MARIAGVNIPTNKRVEIALTYIHGIGNSKAKEITGKVGITPERAGNMQTHGLLGMRERAAYLDGSASISSQPGQGTTVTVRLPLSGGVVATTVPESTQQNA